MRQRFVLGFGGALALSLGPLPSAALFAQTAPAARPAEAPPRASGGDIVSYAQIHHPTIGRDGMVVSQNALAARVGAEILRKGGNAVDAAVATGFALAVTLPRAGNVGGGGYMLVHMAANGARPAETIAIDYYGQAPAATTPDLLLGADGRVDQAKVMSMKGVAIPGTVMGLWEAHRRYGSLRWGTLLAPAISLAERGITLSDDEAEAHADQRALMADDPAATGIFFQRNRAAWRAGDRLVQRDLGWTLRQIARRGPDGFYRGPVAERIVAGMRSGGGVMTLADLGNYRAVVSAPLWSTYRGHRIALMPPGASGVSVAQALNILERIEPGTSAWGSVMATHRLAEALKIAAADRRMVGGGPDWITPTTGLASPAYAAERARLVRDNRALGAADLPRGAPERYESPDTTHYSVADRWGNVVSNTYTLSASYGAHVVAPGTGVLLNNSMGNLAWERRGGDAPVATRPVPGKRVGSTITPLIVYQGDRPWLVSGTPGGGYIVATMVQLVSNVIDHRLNVAEAAQRPRINQGGPGSPLEYEAGFSPVLAERLAAMGHVVRPSNSMGSVQSIMIERRTDGETRFLGAADTRRPDAGAIGVR